MVYVNVFPYAHLYTPHLEYVRLLKSGLYVALQVRACALQQLIVHHVADDQVPVGRAPPDLYKDFVVSEAHAYMPVSWNDHHLQSGRGGRTVVASHLQSAANYRAALTRKDEVIIALKGPQDKCRMRDLRPKCRCAAMSDCLLGRHRQSSLACRQRPQLTSTAAIHPLKKMV
jgi:hypothetical protein